MKQFIFIAGLLALTACNQNQGPKKSTYEISGNATQRMAMVSAIIGKHTAPPTALLDAHLVEEKIGDGNLGPSDFTSFCLLEVAVQDVSKWLQLLTPLTNKAEYAAPAKARDWWLDRGAFDSLRFYQPDNLTGRRNAWIGVDQKTGHIYIHTFSM